jgi:hypothetical protein
MRQVALSYAPNVSGRPDRDVTKIALAKRFWGGASRVRRQTLDLIFPDEVFGRLPTAAGRRQRPGGRHPERAGVGALRAWV